MGVLGAGIINSGQPGGAAFGFRGNDPVVIPFVPEPSAATLALFALAAVTCLRRRTYRPLCFHPIEDGTAIILVDDATIVAAFVSEWESVTLCRSKNDADGETSDASSSLLRV